ncbi:ABC transporter permease [Sphingobium sufflavum]|uniref:ABC transporter permease n=1 Tax=Sphingobium sufflavum TaxID=1129547 RepID=UPI001F231F88|nr:ABC transporter permease [Sphingobium sufflavum]MCE7796458.1 ABC transporter permease [Sphingobium sufflavum]
MTVRSAEILRPPFPIAPNPLAKNSREEQAPSFVAEFPSTQLLVRGTRRLGMGDAVSYGWLLGPALLLVYWSLGSATGFIDGRILPAPWVAVTTGVDLIEQGRLQQHLLVSLLRAAQGIAFGTVAGVLVALLSGLSLLGGYIFDGIIQVKRAVPALALIPFFILWFGIGEVMKVTVVTLGVFIPIYIHTHNALRSIDIKHVELAETMGIRYSQFIRHVVLPGALPGFLLGLRFGVMGAWLGLVVVEQFNTTSGIGYMINLARNYAQADVMLVGLVLYAVFGLLSDRLVRSIESRSLTWRRTLAQ